MGLLRFLGIGVRDDAKSSRRCLPKVGRATVEAYLAEQGEKENFDTKKMSDGLKQLLQENGELALYLAKTCLKIGGGDPKERGSVAYGLGFLQCYDLLKRQREIEDLEGE